MTYFIVDSARTHQTHLDLWNFVNEDYIAGYTQDGQMSTVRRFFLLFVAFDLFFISMLWFICIMVNELILIESNLVVSHLLYVLCFIDERRKHCPCSQ